MNDVNILTHKEIVETDVGITIINVSAIPSSKIATICLQTFFKDDDRGVGVASFTVRPETAKVLAEILKSYVEECEKAERGKTNGNGGSSLGV